MRPFCLVRSVSVRYLVRMNRSRGGLVGLAWIVGTSAFGWVAACSSFGSAPVSTSDAGSGSPAPEPSATTSPEAGLPDGGNVPEVGPPGTGTVVDDSRTFSARLLRELTATGTAYTSFGTTLWVATSEGRLVPEGSSSSPPIPLSAEDRNRASFAVVDDGSKARWASASPGLVRDGAVVPGSDRAFAVFGQKDRLYVFSDPPRPTLTGEQGSASLTLFVAPSPLLSFAVSAGEGRLAYLEKSGSVVVAERADKSAAFGAARRFKISSVLSNPWIVGVDEGATTTVGAVASCSGTGTKAMCLYALELN